MSLFLGFLFCSIGLLGIYPKELKSGSQRDICTPVFTAALFTITKTWKPPKYPLTDEWLKKMSYIHSMGYYLALKKEILPFVTTWMNLEEFMLSKISQSQKDKYYMIPLT